VKVVKKKANKTVPKSANEQRKNRHFFLFHHRLSNLFFYYKIKNK